MLFHDMSASPKKTAKPLQSLRPPPSQAGGKGSAPSDIYRVPSRPKAIPPRVNGRRVDG